MSMSDAPLSDVPAHFPAQTDASSTPPIAINAPATVSIDTHRLCVELARQARDFHADRDWAGIAPLLQRIWTREAREIPWDDASALIHAAWLASPRG